MLVATALVMFIMLILSEAFVAGLEAFRTLKGIGDMEERLRAAALMIRSDLEFDHFESGVRLGDSNFWRLGNPKQGFLNITQGFDPTFVTSPVTATGLQTVSVPSLTVASGLNSGVAMWTIQPGSVLLVDSGGSAEFVLVQSTPSPTQFTAVFQNLHNPTPFAPFPARFVRQYEGNDSDGLPLSRATDHVLYMAVKQKGDRQENLFTAHMPYILPYNPMPPYILALTVNPFFATRPDGTPNPNYAPSTFGDQPTDARFQDPLPLGLPGGANPHIGYKTQWAEVAYFLWPNGSTAGGTPLYALYRCEFKVVPDSRYLNGKGFNPPPTSPPAVLPPPPIANSFTAIATGLQGISNSWVNDGFNEMSCQLTPVTGGSGPPFNYSFNTPTDLAGSNVPPGAMPSFTRAFTASAAMTGGGSVPSRGIFSPANVEAWSATLVATDVVSFDIQIAPGGSPASTGGMLATSELPWSSPNSIGVPALSILPSGPTPPFTFTNDFVDIPSGSFDTALQSNNYNINAVRIILRVWNMKTNQTRQVSIVQQL
jgi:hypothetical protein